MSNNEIILIQTREDLYSLLSRHIVHLVPQHTRRISLRLAALTQEQNDQWSKKIHAAYFACGCSEGAIFLMFSMIAFIIYLFLHWQVGIHFHQIIIGLVFVFFSSMFGKIFGLFLAKVRLRIAVKKILIKL
jgi:hypothetical protein